VTFNQLLFPAFYIRLRHHAQLVTCRVPNLASKDVSIATAMQTLHNHDSTSTLLLFSHGVCTTHLCCAN